MKRCIKCKAEFESTDWICPVCHWSPLEIDGFSSFAPELAFINDGTPQNAHHFLDKIQEQSFWFRQRNQLIQDMIRSYFPESCNVLEIGCGNGYVLSGIRNVLPMAHLTGTEIYSYALKYAEKKISQPNQFLQMDARQLPFKEEFDLIGIFDVLEHIEEDELVVENIRESLNPSGGVIITVPQHPFLWSKVDTIACHKRRYRRKQLANLLRAQDFEILIDTSFMFFLMPIMLIQRMIGNRISKYDAEKEFSLPKIVDKVFESFLLCERVLIKFGLQLPVGGSRIVVAKLASPKYS